MPRETVEKPCILLTGATGQLGWYLLRDLLLDEQPLAVLARSTRYKSAYERIEVIIQYWERELGLLLPRPYVIDGDLSQRDLGLSSDDREWLRRHCGSVIHNAASVVFVSQENGVEPYTVNVLGTQHLMEVCQACGIDSCDYISTAYVCGETSEIVRETDADLNTAFRNDYERSKAQGETIVRAAFGERASIFRPSIIVGDSQTGFCTKFRTYYTPLQMTYLLAMQGRLNSKTTPPEYFEMDYEDGKNLVPVDWVSKAILEIRSNRDSRGRVFHLTNPQNVSTRMTIRVMLRLLEERCGFSEIPLLGDVTEAEAADLDESMEVYRNYLSDDPRFEDQNVQEFAESSCPEIDEDCLGTIIEYALRVKFAPPRLPAIEPFSLLDQSIHSRVPGASDTTGDLQHFSLCAIGPGGGAWEFSVQNDDVRLVNRGYCRHGGIVIYANASMLQEYFEDRRSLEALLCSGDVLMIAGDSNVGERCLVALKESLQPQVTTRNAA